VASPNLIKVGGLSDLYFTGRSEAGWSHGGKPPVIGSQALMVSIYPKTGVLRSADPESWPLIWGSDLPDPF